VPVGVTVRLDPAQVYHRPKCLGPATVTPASSQSRCGVARSSTTPRCRPITARSGHRGPGDGSVLEATGGGGCGPVRTTSRGSPGCGSLGGGAEWIPAFLVPWREERRLTAVSTPLFDFNREAIAAELSSAPNGTYLVKLEMAWTVRPPSVETFAPIHSGHPAIEAMAKRQDFPYSLGMDIPVEVMIPAVENELKSHGCQIVVEDHPTKSEVLARWTWPPLR
jgi:hypothetical protein